MAEATEDVAGSSDAAAAAGMRPQRPVDCAAAGAAGGADGALLEAAWREATLQPRSWWDLGTTWGPAEPLQWATVVGLVDSASEKYKARAVVEIYLNRGRYPLGLHPFDTTKRDITAAPGAGTGPLLTWPVLELCVFS